MGIVLLPVIWLVLAIACALRACGDHIFYNRSRQNKVSLRHFRILTVSGIASYILQVAIHTQFYGTPDYQLWEILVTILAFVCFLEVTSERFITQCKYSQRDLFQTLLWGQAVFPLTLLAVPGFTAIFGIS